MRKRVKQLLVLTLFAVISVLMMACTEIMVTVTFQTNGGTPVSKIEVFQGYYFSTLPETTRTGHTFDGWYDDAELLIPFDLSHPMNRNRTLYAKWIVNSYIITFNTHGGEGFDPLELNYNTNLLIPDPVKDGFVFVGWYIDADYTIEFEDIRMPDQDLVLHAKWHIITYQVVGTYIFEKENLVTHEMEPDGTPVPFELTDQLYASEFFPNETFEAYDFVHFVYNDVIYTDPLQITENMSGVEVYYARKVITITFRQNPSEVGGPSGIVDDVFHVYYNDDFEEDVPVLLVDDPGFIAVWDRFEFVNMTEDALVRAIYYESGVKAITFIDGGMIRYIATQGVGEDQIISELAPIWNLSKPGFKFMGWFDDAQNGTQLSIENMKFSLFAESQNIYAKWDPLMPFSSPTDISILVDGAGSIFIEWILNPTTIEGYMPAEYVLTLNGVPIVVETNLITVDGTLMMLAVTDEDDLYADFSVLLEPGIHALTIKAVGDLEHHMSGPYSAVYQYAVDTEIAGEVTDIAIYDYFIVESIDINETTTKNFIFYTDLTYNFSDRYHFEILTGHAVIAADGKKLITSGESGLFTFSMTLDGGAPVTYQGRVIESIKQFGYGSHYQTYLAESNGTNYLKVTPDDYLVGYKNNFYLDLRMVDNKGDRISLSNVLLEYTFFLNDEAEALTSEVLEEYVEFLPNNVLKFTPEADGNRFKIIVRPRYQATMMQVNDVEFEFVINNAHNAFTNAQLKQLFANLAVTDINIHANIKAELAANQLNADGSPINLFAVPSTGNIRGNIYGRVDGNTDNDRIQINGNYMTIDGSDLPYSNKDSGFGTVGYSASFEIVSVQISIFYYDVLDESRLLTAESHLNNNQFFMSNLTILGNTTTPQINYGLSAGEITSQEQLMSRNSGGYTGIIVRNGASTFSNLRLGYTLIAFTNNAYGVASSRADEPLMMVVEHVKIYDSWANSFYSYGGTGIEIRASDIGRSGGAAIHMVDTRPGSGIDTPTLILDNDTLINNWISGEEAWFKAYGMSVVALQLKSAIQGAITPLGKSVIKLMTNPVTGLETEMINLILLTEPSGNAIDNPDAQTTGSEIKLILNDDTGEYTLQRSFDFLTNDARVQGNQFLFAVGNLSNTTAFMTAVGYLMGTYDLSQGDAINLAFIAGFYHLSADQAYQAYGAMLMHGLTLHQAVAAVTGNPDHPLPRYLEVLAPVPLFTSGYSVILIEIFNTE